MINSWMIFYVMVMGEIIERMNTANKTERVKD
jgi:hypothetical protein